MSTKRDTRESEASGFVLKSIEDVLNSREGGKFFYNCPSPKCLGMVKIVIQVNEEECCVTAQCTDSSPECDFPTLNGPLKFEGEVAK